MDTIKSDPSSNAISAYFDRFPDIYQKLTQEPADMEIVPKGEHETHVLLSNPVMQFRIFVDIDFSKIDAERAEIIDILSGLGIAVTG